jgi:hypothetical protein
MFDKAFMLALSILKTYTSSKTKNKKNIMREIMGYT